MEWWNKNDEAVGIPVVVSLISSFHVLMIRYWLVVFVCSEHVYRALCFAYIRIGFSHLIHFTMYMTEFLLLCTSIFSHAERTNILSRGANKHSFWCIFIQMYVYSMLCVCVCQKMYSILLHYSNLCAHFPKRRKLRQKYVNISHYNILCPSRYLIHAIEQCKFAWAEEWNESQMF